MYRKALITITQSNVSLQGADNELTIDQNTGIIADVACQVTSAM